MADQTGAGVVVDTEECSTNFYYTIGKEEKFNCQLTIRGNPTPEQIAAHIRSSVAAMQAIVTAGGKAKQIGGAAPQGNGDAPSSQFEFYKGNKGKTFIKIPPGQAEPNEITCPVHGQKMKRKTNDHGAWYSHKDGESWCSIAVPD